MNNKDELQRRVAWLESRLDQVESELAELNHLLVNCGFPDGVRTLRATITDLMDEASDLYPHNPEDYPPTQTFDPFA